jgi:hypothetical protein
MRIAKNETIHAIWLKFSTMLRSSILHGFHGHGYDSAVLSGKLCKVSRFVRLLVNGLLRESGRLPVHSLSVNHHVHGFPLSGTFFVRRFPRNSWRTVTPAIPASPMKELVKTRFAPRSAWG